jgi:hypothetical protein
MALLELTRHIRVNAENVDSALDCTVVGVSFRTEDARNGQSTTPYQPGFIVLAPRPRESRGNLSRSRASYFK